MEADELKTLRPGDIVWLQRATHFGVCEWATVSRVCPPDRVRVLARYPGRGPGELDLGADEVEHQKPGTAEVGASRADRRRQYACAALIARGDPGFTVPDPRDATHWSDVARQAFALADAMIAEEELDDGK